jgi:phosphoadenosine phosphosulfate reductase
MDAELKAKIALSLDRIESAYEIAEKRGTELVVAYSGGKDSDVLIDLALESGVPFRAQHCVTSVDAPETVRHIKAVFSDLRARGVTADILPPPKIELDGRQVYATMWTLIEKNGMPPTRIMRYCCEHLKERHFDGQHLLFGVRWAESASRKKSRGLHETLTKSKTTRITYTDENDDEKKDTEICHSKNRIATNPIIDWSDADVWMYVKERGIKLNPLYTMGFTRVGCIGCPMARSKVQSYELRLYPHIKALYLKAFEKMLVRLWARGKTTRWQTADDVMDWWLSDIKKAAADDNIDGQLDLIAMMEDGDYAAEQEDAQ